MSKTEKVFYWCMFIFFILMSVLCTPIAFVEVYDYLIGNECSWAFVGFGVFSPAAAYIIMHKMRG